MTRITPLSPIYEGMLECLNGDFLLVVDTDFIIHALGGSEKKVTGITPFSPICGGNVGML